MSLKTKLAIRFLLGGVVIGAMLFLPAGTFRYWQGWAYLLIWFIPMGIAFRYFLKHDPKLVERRLQGEETVREQKWIRRILIVIYVIAFLLPGLDHRFGWSHVPLWLTIVSLIVVFAGYAITLWVMKVNSFAGRTIQVESGQRVITDGPYGMVRHPMYLGMSLLFLSTPLALGSFVALLAFALLIPLIILRLLSEERVLRQELPGYVEYCAHTRFRLVPMLW